MATAHGDSVSSAWLAAIRHLLNSGGACYNLMVEIDRPLDLDPQIDQAYCALVERHGLIPVKDVAYTIFPYSCYLRVDRDPERLFDRYNRPCGVFDHLRRKKHFNWGTYFRRMAHYADVDRFGKPAIVNQLAQIRQMLQERRNAYKASYTVNIRRPSHDLRLTQGSPCLIALAIQLHRAKLCMLAVYRRQDFVERAYGNYRGLGHLMEFLVDGSRYSVGALTCIASYASLDRTQGRKGWPHRSELRQLVAKFEDIQS